MVDFVCVYLCDLGKLGIYDSRSVCANVGVDSVINAILMCNLLAVLSRVVNRHDIALYGCREQRCRKNISTFGLFLFGWVITGACTQIDFQHFHIFTNFNFR